MINIDEIINELVEIYLKTTKSNDLSIACTENDQYIILGVGRFVKCGDGKDDYCPLFTYAVIIHKSITNLTCNDVMSVVEEVSNKLLILGYVSKVETIRKI